MHDKAGANKEILKSFKLASVDPNFFIYFDFKFFDSNFCIFFVFFIFLFFLLFCSYFFWYGFSSEFESLDSQTLEPQTRWPTSTLPCITTFKGLLWLVNFHLDLLKYMIREAFSFFIFKLGISFIIPGQLPSCIL